MNDFNPQIVFTAPDANSVGAAVTRVWSVLSESDQQRVLDVLRRGLTKLFKQGMNTGEKQ